MLTRIIVNPAAGGPLIQHCIIPEPIIPLFQHSNWGEAPNLYIVLGIFAIAQTQPILQHELDITNNSAA